MVVNFANIDLQERPILILENAGGTVIGVLGNAMKVSLDLKYNETSTLEFELPDHVDGVKDAFYDAVIGMRVIQMPGIGRFTLVSPEEEDDGVRKIKQCKAYSLEYEFVYKKLTVAEGTYKFWDSDSSARSDTILGMIMELMPSWSVDSNVPDTLVNKYRTFEVSNENLYNFIKDTVQKSYGCIFDFDTLTRTVYIRDVEDDASEEPVYISTGNLAKEITVSENVEDIVTRLDVNGADGVDIRDVNPTGTNKIINLDYFMNTENFSQNLIDKYFTWKSLVDSSRSTYYSLQIEYTMLVMQRTTERARLTDMKSELTILENAEALAMQAYARELIPESDVEEAKQAVADKAVEVGAKETEIEGIEQAIQSAYAQLLAIKEQCDFKSYFTNSEFIELDRYIKDGEISESSFVSSAITDYADKGRGVEHTNTTLSITGAEITHSTIETDTETTDVYDVRGGTMTLGSDMTAKIVTATIDVRDTDDLIFTMYLNSGVVIGVEFASGCISGTGTVLSLNTDSVSIVETLDGEPGTYLTMVFNGYSYFTLNASEYQKRSVAWDLYEYGEEQLAKLSQPTYTFEVNSANFFALKEFVSFKNKLSLGQKAYVDIGDRVLTPILTGANIYYDSLDNLELEFSDSYTSNDTSFKLADILEQSVSMGKTVDVGKFNYESFNDSGASTAIKSFMESALDISKNAIIGSSNQAISLDEAGLRLRRRDTSTGEFEPEQVWMNNNSIMLTDDAWETAKMAIGKFKDESFSEDCWGIVASTIVGTMIAGETLVIESQKKDGGHSVFRVDSDGCRMYNGNIAVVGDDSTVWTYRASHVGGLDVVETVDGGEYVGTLPVGTIIICTKQMQSGGVTFAYGVAETGEAGWIQTGSGYTTLVGSTTKKTHVLLDPDLGAVIGVYPVYDEDPDTQVKALNDNAKMWVDADGNVHIKGILEGANGKFSGAVNATYLNIGGQSSKDYVAGIVDDAIEIESVKYLIDNTDNTVLISCQNTAPATATANDLWYNTDNGMVSRHNGSSFESIDNEGLRFIVSSSLDARKASEEDPEQNFVITAFSRNNTPTGTMHVGDLWVKTNEDNALYKYDGTTWNESSDARISSLMKRVTTVESKVTDEAIESVVRETTIDLGSEEETTVGEIGTYAKQSSDMISWAVKEKTGGEDPYEMTTAAITMIQNNVRIEAGRVMLDDDPVDGAIRDSKNDHSNMTKWFDFKPEGFVVGAPDSIWNTITDENGYRVVSAKKEIQGFDGEGTVFKANANGVEATAYSGGGLTVRPYSHGWIWKTR